MAARDTGLGAVEQYMHQGKLLALDLLTRVLSDPHHSWIHARPQVGTNVLCLAGDARCRSYGRKAWACALDSA